MLAKFMLPPMTTSSRLTNFAGFLLALSTGVVLTSVVASNEERFLQTLPTTCASMERVCTSETVSFSAQTGMNLSAIDSTNDFGCLETQPNPTWYSFSIAEPGDLFMSLYAPDDIDYIIWGPFSDEVTAKAACNGGLTSPLNQSCSYSKANDERPNINGTLGGEVYVMLVTNYAGAVQPVSFRKIGGDAETDCTGVATKSAKNSVTLTKAPSTKAPSTKTPTTTTKSSKAPTTANV